MEPKSIRLSIDELIRMCLRRLHQRPDNNRSKNTDMRNLAEDLVHCKY